MPVPQADHRSSHRKVQDEQIAAEPQLPPPDLGGAQAPRPMEDFLPRRQPVAVIGIVENGLVRPLDPQVRLPDRSRVIIVASDSK